MNEQTVVYSYDRILLSNKKEQTSDVYHRIDESQNNHEWNKKRLRIIWLHLHKILENAK